MKSIEGSWARTAIAILATGVIYFLLRCQRLRIAARAFDVPRRDARPVNAADRRARPARRLSGCPDFARCAVADSFEPRECWRRMREYGFTCTRPALRPATSRRRAGFTAIAILTLALGIGANVAIFTVVNAVLIRPLPFPNPDRLVRIAADARATNGRNIGISQPELDDLRDRAGVFDGVTAMWPVSASFLGGDRPERVEVLVTSANYFQLLGAGAQLGRVYGPADAVPGFSDAGRDQRRALAPRVRGRARRHRPQGGHGHRHLHGRRRHAARLPSSRRDGARRRGHVECLRLRRGAVHESAAASAELHSRRDGTAEARHLAAAGAGSPRRARRRTAGELSDAIIRRTCSGRCVSRSAQSELTSRIRPTLSVLMGAVVLLLVIACVNIANLTLARASSRAARDRRAARARRDPRSARAAAAHRKSRHRDRRRRSRARRARVVEGLDRRHDAGRSAAAHRSAFRRPHGRDRARVVDCDGRRVRHRACDAGLRCQSWRQPEGRGPRARRTDARERRFRGTLVAAEIAISLVLLVGAGLLVRSFWSMLQVNPGLDPARVGFAQIWIPVPNDPSKNPYATPAQRNAYINEVLRRVGALPGVESVGMSASNRTPFSGSGVTQRFTFVGESTAPADVRRAQFQVASPQIFRDAEIANPQRPRVHRGRYRRNRAGRDRQRNAREDAVSGQGSCRPQHLARPAVGPHRRRRRRHSRRWARRAGGFEGLFPAAPALEQRADGLLSVVHGSRVAEHRPSNARFTRSIRRCRSSGRARWRTCSRTRWCGAGSCCR